MSHRSMQLHQDRAVTKSNKKQIVCWPIRQFGTPDGRDFIQVEYAHALLFFSSVQMCFLIPSDLNTSVDFSHQNYGANYLLFSCPLAGPLRDFNLSRSKCLCLVCISFLASHSFQPMWNTVLKDTLLGPDSQNILKKVIFF